MAEKKNPFGDGQGTRVGRPNTPERDNVKDGQADGVTTDAGAEAARGIQAGNSTAADSDARAGSEPLTDRKDQSTPSYGGKMGKPRPVPDK